MSGRASNLVVAIDSMTLVWGIRRQETPEQLQRAAWLFENLDNENAQIIPPSVVVSEYLVPVDPKHHAAVLAEMSQRFLISPFDVQCASLAAQLFVEGKGGVNKGLANSRICLKADCLIIATAVCHGAKLFFSGDKEGRERARKYIEPRDLPTMADSLFPPTDSTASPPPSSP